MKCNLCGSLYYKVIYNIEKQSAKEDTVEYKISEDKIGLSSLRIVRCLKCGLIYVNPQQNIKEILAKYRNMQDEIYLLEEKGRREAAKIILKKITKYKKGKGKILDIGCATGFLLYEARKQGWQPYGVELAKWAVNIARERFDLNIFEGTLEEAGFPDNYFDAIVVIDVIEHMRDPKKMLEEARRILKPDGIFCISAPDINSFLSKILRAKWWGIKQYHLYYFSRKIISKFFDATGFKVIKYTSHVRVFSGKYLGRQLSNHNVLLYKLFNFIIRHLFLENRLLKLNFKDQIEVFAKKKRTLAFISQDEKVNKEEFAKKRMKTIVVLPAYNASRTLALTIRDIPKDIVDKIILVDDGSKDNTIEVARQLGLEVFEHCKNKGYGANQKTSYTKALEMGADIVVMVHPDYQYDPKVIPQLIEPIRVGQADAVFGSRMMKGGALEGGMPLWKHNANVLLTALENVVLGTYLSEYHSGFRAYSANYLRTVNFLANSDGFVFDTEIIVQGLLHYFKIDEIPIRTRYFEEASTIKLLPSLVYGLRILNTLLKYILHAKGIIKFKQFE